MRFGEDPLNQLNNKVHWGKVIIEQNDSEQGGLSHLRALFLDCKFITSMNLSRVTHSLFTTPSYFFLKTPLNTEESTLLSRFLEDLISSPLRVSVGSRMGYFKTP